MIKVPNGGKFIRTSANDRFGWQALPGDGPGSADMP